MFGVSILICLENYLLQDLQYLRGMAIMKHQSSWFTLVGASSLALVGKMVKYRLQLPLQQHVCVSLARNLK